MCNRYRLKAKPDELIDLFELSRDPGIPDISAEFFPGKAVPVVRQHRDVRQLDEMTWGVPPFKGKRPINNTRSEKAASSPFWSRHLGHRCAFPLTEAIEWQHQVNTRTGELRKVPYTIRFRDGRIAAVAGIYSADSDDACCSMMTCRANSVWATIHNAQPDDPRMVCFLLDPEAIAIWLDPDRDYESVRALLQPVPDEADLLVAEPGVSPTDPPATGIDGGSLFGQCSGMSRAAFPIVGFVGAGFPKASEGYEDHPIDLQELLVTRPAATFFFRVQGDALRSDGVPSGAVLVVDRSIQPRPGRLAVVEQEGAFVVRRLQAQESAIVCGVVTASIVRI